MDAFSEEAIFCEFYASFRMTPIIVGPLPEYYAFRSRPRISARFSDASPKRCGLPRFCEASLTEVNFGRLLSSRTADWLHKFPDTPLRFRQRDPGSSQPFAQHRHVLLCHHQRRWSQSLLDQFARLRPLHESIGQFLFGD